MKQRCTIKNKPNKTVWRYGDIKIVFSDMSFQTNDEYAYVKSIDEALFLNYTVSIYRKPEKYNSSGKRKKTDWKKVSSIYASDFPGLLDLKYMLEKILGCIPIEECQATACEGNRIIYEWNISNDDFISNDCYRVSKTVIVENGMQKYEYFSFYAGCSTDSQGGFLSTGINFNRIEKEALQVLYECICISIKNAIAMHNIKTKNFNMKCMESVFTENGRLYQKLTWKQAEDIYFIGDRLSDLKVLSGDMDSEDFCSKCYHDVVISDVSDGRVVISDGYLIDGRTDTCTNNNETTIPATKILHISRYVDTEKLLNEDALIADFMEKISDTETEEFVQMELNALVYKWKEALIGIYLMCIKTKSRFTTTVKDEGYHEDVYDAVKNIIRKIKERLSIKSNQ